jgi:SpoVK/Ycf46/Vps4 family AAA+-type ATPase
MVLPMLKGDHVCSILACKRGTESQLIMPLWDTTPQIDGLSNAAPAADGKPEARRVMVLAATNFPWDIDEAMR